MRATLTLLLAATAVLAPAASAAAASGDDRYGFHGRCVAMRSADGFVAPTAGGWRTDARAGAPLRMQATDLGRYLLMTRDGAFVTAGATHAVSRADASAGGDWRLDEARGGTFTLRLPESGRRLGSAGGLLTSTRDGERFTLEPAARCADFPEVEVNVTGTPYQGPTPFGETKGLIETHLHGMAFEFLGGMLHCGRPWHPFGAPAALVDCPDHAGNGQGAAAENFLAHGDPTRGHHTDGWPTFQGWPHYKTYTHEQTYYKWLERAWRGGLRLYTNLLVENESLCTLYPLKRNSCNEMDGVRLQRQRLDEFIAYIDAQHGGPGKGWLQIVRDPFEARRVINEGKLALVVGIEISKLFDCGEINRVPQCNRAQIDRNLDAVHAMGVRQMELVNKLDNALVGVAGDAGSTGVLTNSANKEDTGHFWAMQTCDPTHTHDHDKEQLTPGDSLGRDALAGQIAGMFIPQDQTPFYGPGPHCNQTGLTDLGAYVIRRMMDKHMIFDPDHMSVRGRDEALSIIESRRYGGVMSSHSWSTPDAYRRILALGGLVTPATKTSERFVTAVEELRAERNTRYLFGTGWSTDMNGFAAQGGPRPGNEKNPVVYPFRSLDGSTMLDRQKSGTRTFDLNTDGTAHFGLYPDRLEDVRIIGGPQIQQDLLNGAEAYLQMWERAEGVPHPQCRAAQRRFISRGFGEVRIGMNPEQVLRSAGQPESRAGHLWRWCADGTRRGKMLALMDDGGQVQMVASTAPFHRFRGIGKNSRESRVRRHSRRIADGLYMRSAGRSGHRVFYVTRKGRVRSTALISREVATSRAKVEAVLEAADLR